MNSGLSMLPDYHNQRKDSRQTSSTRQFDYPETAWLKPWDAVLAMSYR